MHINRNLLLFLLLSDLKSPIIVIKLPLYLRIHLWHEIRVQ
jgi:hypothetical protein